MVHRAQNPPPGEEGSCGGSLDALRASLQVRAQDKAWWLKSGELVILTAEWTPRDTLLQLPVTEK